LAREASFEVRRFPVFFGVRAHGHSHWNFDWASKKKFIKRTVAFSSKLKNLVKK
jgi:hypothetical protein